MLCQQAKGRIGRTQVTSVPGKIMKKLIWDSIDKELKDGYIINACQTNLITSLVDKVAT